MTRNSLAVSTDLDDLSPNRLRLIRALGAWASFSIAFLAAAALTTNAFFGETFGTARLTPVLLGLLVLHIARFPRLAVFRELTLYSLFFFYLLVQVSWTQQTALVLNTLAPTLNSLLVMLLVGALLRYHSVFHVLAGFLCGFGAVALVHTAATGFPLAVPPGFSYNAAATAYLFGLYLVLLIGWQSDRRLLTAVLGLVVWLHIVATTSIKTNLGIVLGGLVSSLVYFRHLLTILRRNALAVAILLGVLVYFALSNQSLMDAIARGVDRVSLGIQVLQAQEDLPGYSAFGNRQEWLAAGVEGWMNNPVFGNGVEAFRSRYGITSHSTPIDLLHNSGIIGAALFYSLFASLLWRLMVVGERAAKPVRFVVLAGLICFAFISLTGTVHYNTFLAAFIGSSAVFLTNERRAAWSPTNARAG